jgi:hypothetical protein
VGENRVTETDDLVDRFAFGSKTDEERADLGRRGVSRHDLFHRPGRFRNAEVAALEQRTENVGPTRRFRHEPILSKGTFTETSRL